MKKETNSFRNIKQLKFRKSFIIIDNSSISTLLLGGELRYYCLSMMSLADGLQMFYLQAICKRGSRV